MSSTRAGAEYVAKYASKGVEVCEWSPEMAATVLDAVWGKRLYTASQGFWLPYVHECKDCKAGWHVIHVPDGARAGQPVWLTHGASYRVEELGEYEPSPGYVVQRAPPRLNVARVQESFVGIATLPPTE